MVVLLVVVVLVLLLCAVLLLALGFRLWFWIGVGLGDWFEVRRTSSWRCWGSGAGQGGFAACCWGAGVAHVAAGGLQQAGLRLPLVLWPWLCG